MGPPLLVAPELEVVSFGDSRGGAGVERGSSAGLPIPNGSPRMARTGSRSDGLAQARPPNGQNYTDSYTSSFGGGSSFGSELSLLNDPLDDMSLSDGEMGSNSPLARHTLSTRPTVGMTAPPPVL